MILEIFEKEPYLYIYISSKGKKELDTLLQEIIYIPSLNAYETLQKRVFNMRHCKDIKQKLKEDYFISRVEEYPYYCLDSIDKDIYKIVWRKQRFNKISLPIGTKLYHLTRKHCLDRILQEGLAPSNYSTDNVFYGCNKVFLITKPILSEKEDWIDGHLMGRVQLELTYDGSFEIFEDFEYNHIKGNPMVYSITDKNIKVDKISDIQPSV